MEWDGSGGKEMIGEVRTGEDRVGLERRLKQREWKVMGEWMGSSRG